MNHPQRNAMKNVPCITPEERHFSSRTDGSGRKVPRGLQQKPVECIMYVVYKFCKRKELVLDTCTGTLGIANAGLQVPEQRWIVGCKKDSPFCQNAMRSLRKYIQGRICVRTLA